MAGRDLNKLVGNLFVVMTYIAALACIQRSDYNVAFCLFFYFIWIVKRDPETTQLIFFGTIALSVLDIIWLLSVGNIWTTDVTTNLLWNTLKPSRIFVIVLSSLNLLFKLVTAGLIYYIRKHPDEMSQSIVDKHAMV